MSDVLAVIIKVEGVIIKVEGNNIFLHFVIILIFNTNLAGLQT
jgi:hypothetical protein